LWSPSMMTHARSLARNVSRYSRFLPASNRSLARYWPRTGLQCAEQTPSNRVAITANRSGLFMFVSTFALAHDQHALTLTKTVVFHLDGVSSFVAWHPV